jgi:hypothetical protein
MQKCSETPPFLASLFRAIAAFYSNEVIQKARSLLIGASGDVLGCHLHFLWLVWRNSTCCLDWYCDASSSVSCLLSLLLPRKRQQAFSEDDRFLEALRG